VTILVTGGTGQLAGALARLRPGEVVVTGRPAFDFDRPGSIGEAVAAVKPALVINAAAWTAVDLAEKEPEAAARANHAGPGLLAEACRRHGAGLIHVSTDYVFDGAKGAPYVETDPTNPTGVYGATKLAGEHAVLASLPGAVILRTAWVYAEHGKNFVLTMLNAAKRMPRLRVVADQIGCPTNADDLAAACLGVADRMLAAPGNHDLGGIYHATGRGETSWHGFAQAIFAAAARDGWPSPPVDAILTADWPTPARRPADSRLDCGKLLRVFGVSLPAWQPSLDRAVAAICRAAPTGPG
jgi:dTDP-4-dehydrorhamnose reductase